MRYLDTSATTGTDCRPRLRLGPLAACFGTGPESSPTNGDDLSERWPRACEGSVGLVPSPRTHTAIAT